jgi:regulator of nucleoside diphosphate kinase
LEETVEQRSIYISAFDKKRLLALIDAEISGRGRLDDSLQNLKSELEKGIVVEPDKMPPNVVTMNSTVLFRDMEDNEEMTYTLVFPAHADMDQSKLSILAPIGTALIGYREGSIIEWKVPSGVQRIKIEKVLFQPESQGSYEL